MSSDNITYIKNFVITMLLFFIPEVILINVCPFNGKYWGDIDGRLFIDVLFVILVIAQSIIIWFFSEIDSYHYEDWKGHPIMNTLSQVLTVDILCFRFCPKPVAFYVFGIILLLTFFIFGLIALFKWDTGVTVRHMKENIRKRKEHKTYVLEDR